MKSRKKKKCVIFSRSKLSPNFSNFQTIVDKTNVTLLPSPYHFTQFWSMNDWRIERLDFSLWNQLSLLCSIKVGKKGAMKSRFFGVTLGFVQHFRFLYWILLLDSFLCCKVLISTLCSETEAQSKRNLVSLF